MGLLSIQTSKRLQKEAEASKESTQACCLFYAFWFGFSCFVFSSFSSFIGI
jgi:hypothetical protein